ncbi:MAG: hypothetical protein AB8B73_08285 [Ekhidna sp.]
MKLNLFIAFYLFTGVLIYAQVNELDFRSVTVNEDLNFDGYELIDTMDKQLFVLAEHWHNIQKAPEATLKLLKYLHKEANLRILAIEQGESVAFMINNYLESGDTTLLKQITRNTLFWGKENRQFFVDLRNFNLSIPESEQISIWSVDIEYKMASAIFVINELIADKEIPSSLHETVGAFQFLFQDTKTHREQYDGLAVMYYYDRDLVEALILKTLNDLETSSEEYISYFGDDFVQFATLILEMDDGLTFDYTNPNTNYKFRDRLIYKKTIELVEANPDVGVLCVIGMRHATKGSSMRKLNELSFSPLFGRVTTIRISALYNKLITSSDLKRFHFNYPEQLRSNPATLIRHDPDDSALKSSKDFDYTLFINSTGNLTPFEKVYTEVDN